MAAAHSAPPWADPSVASTVDYAPDRRRMDRSRNVPATEPGTGSRVRTSRARARVTMRVQGASINRRTVMPASSRAPCSRTSCWPHGVPAVGKHDRTRRSTARHLSPCLCTATKAARVGEPRAVARNPAVLRRDEPVSPLTIEVDAGERSGRTASRQLRDRSGPTAGWPNGSPVVATGSGHGRPAAALGASGRSTGVRSTWERALPVAVAWVRLSGKVSQAPAKLNGGRRLSGVTQNCVSNRPWRYSYCRSWACRPRFAPAASYCPGPVRLGFGVLKGCWLWRSDPRS